MLLEVIHITKRTLVISGEFGNPLLSHRLAGNQQRKGQKTSGHNDGTYLHWASNRLIRP